MITLGSKGCLELLGNFGVRFSNTQNEQRWEQNETATLLIVKSVHTLLKTTKQQYLNPTPALLEWSLSPTHSVPTMIKIFFIFILYQAKWGFIQISLKALLFVTAQSVPSQMQCVNPSNLCLIVLKHIIFAMIY